MHGWYEVCNMEISPGRKVISQKAFIKLFCSNQFPQKNVNSSFIIANLKKKLTDLCGN